MHESLEMLQHQVETLQHQAGTRQLQVEILQHQVEVNFNYSENPTSHLQTLFSPYS
jgi:chaperonin cofactor prefoldin